MLYRGATAAAFVAVELDSLTAVFHRASGTTHLLIEPAPQLLEMLADAALTLEEVRARLAARFELPDVADDALAARLEELVETGLVERR